MREDLMQMPCQECDTNNATTLCEDCGAMLCSSCLESRSSQYFVCNECHCSLGTPNPGEHFDECPECGAKNIGKGRKVEEVCPRCHSANVISIEAKRRNLAQQLRAAIMGLHHGHTKLREFNSSLTSAKRLLVSLRMANFLHYKWLEDNIESLNEEMNAFKNRIMNQAEIVAKRIAAETKGLIDYNNWTAAQFPFIEGITHRVTQIADQYKAAVDDTLKNARASLDDITKQLEGLDYYRKRFAGFYDVTELSVNELPVCALPDIRITGSDFLRNDKATGVLYITNRRVIFIAETGLVRKKSEVIFDFPLMYLSSIEEDGRFRKRLVLKMKQGEIKIACNEQTQKVLPDYVEIGRKFDRYVQTDLQRVRKIEQKDTNVSDARMKIEGLVYSLLSSNQPTRNTIPEQATLSSYQRQSEWGQSSGVRSNYHDRHPFATQGYRGEPQGFMDRKDISYGDSSILRRGRDLPSLHRSALELEDALYETVELLRKGRIVPEDFIRRYRVLMKNSYETRQEMQKLESRFEQPRW